MRNENLSPKRNVHSSIICNSFKLEATHCSSTEEWMNKLRYIHSMEYYSAKTEKKKKPRQLIHSKTLCKVKKANPKVYITFDSVYITSLQ